MIRKQLKSKHLDWKRLKTHEKRDNAKKILNKVLADYDFSKEAFEKLDNFWFSLNLHSGYCSQIELNVALLFHDKLWQKRGSAKLSKFDISQPSIYLFAIIF